jgi:hypothetical protein
MLLTKTQKILAGLVIVILVIIIGLVAWNFRPNTEPTYLCPKNELDEPRTVWGPAECDLTNVYEPKKCEIDSDCAILQTTCCPCNMNGRQVALNKSIEPIFREILSAKCNNNIACSAVDACIYTKAVCDNGICHGVGREPPA